MSPDRGDREKLPHRRKAITQKATITGHDGVGTFYITFGEFSDGRLAEVFINAYKVGTFSQGVLDALARTISIAIQFGTPPEAIVKALRNLNFPPRGLVTGSEKVEWAHSVVDWIAQEIEQWYVDEDKRTKRSTIIEAPKPEPILPSKKSVPEQEEDSDDHKLREISGGVVWGPKSDSDTIVSSSSKTVMDNRVSGHKTDGQLCTKCGSNRLIRAGSCFTCTDCGEPNGCS